MRAPTPLRRELLISFGVLFAGAVLLAGTGLTILLPVLESPAEAVVFIGTLVLADLLVVFLFGAAVMRRSLLRPMERLSDEVRRIGEGDIGHRVGAFELEELEQIRGNVNAMADRLIADRRLLAENVESLDRTNRELVEARDQVVHTARLASVGGLAAGIAHEVGNPLGAIMMYVDVARGRMAEDDPGLEILDSIRDEARRIDRIVRGLLDHARPQPQRMGPSGTEDVILRVRDLLQNQGKLDGVDATWTVPEGIPPVIMEPHRLEQVLINLVLNALDALTDVDEPRLEVRLSVDTGDVARMPRKRAHDPPGINYLHRRRVTRDGGGWRIDSLFNARQVVVIEVADNGPGVPEAQRDAIFDPFFTTKELGKGTGLGLSICARLTEGMGGRIEVTGSEWGGARFVIRLPAHPEDDA